MRQYGAGIGDRSWYHSHESDPSKAVPYSACLSDVQPTSGECQASGHVLQGGTWRGKAPFRVVGVSPILLISPQD
jgi:hypothetical protein